MVFLVRPIEDPLLPTACVRLKRFGGGLAEHVIYATSQESGVMDNIHVHIVLV